MRLGYKLALSLVIPLVGLTAAVGYVYQQRSQTMLRMELAKEGRAIALVVQTAAQDYIRDRQPADLRKLIEQISGYERVFGLRIFDPQGRLVYESRSLAGYPFQNQRVLVQVLRTRQPAEMRRTIAGRSVLGFLFPLQNDTGGLLGAGQVLQLESYIEEDAKVNRDAIAALTLAVVIATVTIILLVTRFSVTGPVRELVSSFRRVGGGQLQARVPVRSDDELGLLALEFNRMCEQLDGTRGALLIEQERRREAENRLHNAERLASLGRLAAGLAHEIGTPLHVIGGRAETLARHLAHDERATRSLHAISEQIDRIVRIVRDMLDFAHQRPPVFEPVELASVLRRVTDLLGMEFARTHVRLELELDHPLPQLRANADQLEQVFLNLAFNAIDAMPEGGVLRISVMPELTSHPERPGPTTAHVRIAFEDTGSGISEEHRDHIFDPFFTTKQPGEGTGLGLSVSFGIVEDHDGWFEVDSEPGRGTRIVLRLPVPDGDADSRPEALRA